jgi:hypothetical protein
MHSRFLKDHLLDIEVVAVIGVTALSLYLGTGWLVAIALGLSAFVWIPLLLLMVTHVGALMAGGPPR